MTTLMQSFPTRGLGMEKVSAIIPVVAMGLFLSAGLAAQAQDSVGVATNAAGEKYLVDAKGMSLYYYTKDKTGDSDCNGNCIKAWPAFYAANLTVSPPLDPADFGTIRRSDNSMQTTYKGWPLYYWVRDKNPGDMTGEGVGKVWYILKVPAYTVMISTDKTLGNYLVDGKGMTLYWFAKDTPGKGEGSGGSVANWPAFAPDSFVVPSALDPADFRMVVRGDGTKQATYKGYPLYYFVKDEKRGDIVGQDVKNVWFVIDPEKFPAK